MFVLYVLLGLLGLATAGCVALWVVYVPVGARILVTPPLLLPESCSAIEEGESIEITGADGVTLRGTYLEATTPASLGVVAFCHELNGGRWMALPYLNHLRESGFDVFTFDFRNHGESDFVPGYRPLPWLTSDELADTRAVIDYLASRRELPLGIGLMGVSKGGTAALCAAAGDPRVRAVVTDGAFPIEGMQLHYSRRWLSIYFSHIPFFVRCMPTFGLWIASLWVRLFVKWWHGCDFVNVEQMAARVRQPVLMVQGEKDTMVPGAVAARLRGCLAGRSKLWTAPKAKHNGAIVVARAEYHRRLARFFSKHLPAARPYQRRWKPLRRWAAVREMSA